MVSNGGPILMVSNGGPILKVSNGNPYPTSDLVRQLFLSGKSSTLIPFPWPAFLISHTLRLLKNTCH